jgi:hypothetical protein
VLALLRLAEKAMSAYRKPDRCAWCCARLTPANAAVVGPELVCRDCAESYSAIQPEDRERDLVTATDARRHGQQQRAAMKATARGIA